MENLIVDTTFPLHYYFIGIIVLLTIIGLAYYLYNKQNDNTNQTPSTTSTEFSRSPTTLRSNVSGSLHTNKHVHFPWSVYLKSYKESAETWISNTYNRFLLNSYMSEGGIKTRTIPPNGSLSRMFRGETSDEK